MAPTLELEKAQTPRRDAGALSGFRVYSTVTLCALVALNCLVVTAQASGLVEIAVMAGVGGATTWLAAFWLRRPPVLLIVIAVVSGYVVWVAGAGEHVPLSGVMIACTLALLISRSTMRWRAAGAAVVALLAPIAGWALLVAQAPWVLGAAFSVGSLIAFLVVFALNRYVWGLVLRLDEARQAAADFAIGQERLRIAGDLHDIQGHTLHVIRLKMRLVDRVMDSDLAAARGHLHDADALVVDTLSATREIAGSASRPSFAAELANARALFAAAGIVVSEKGEPDAWDDPLAALLVREATTNVLRHSQATDVRFTFTTTTMTIENDGCSADQGALSGLARLATRLDGVGITLETFVTAGTFRTRATRR